MILERLRVEGFRHLAAPYELIPDERLTIISAPNGTGKSTLLDALYHGLLEKHTVSGALATERFASRGRDLVPRIVIDFRVGDIRYRTRKNFLSDRLSKLERWESGRYVPFKEGSASDDFVRDLFAAEAPGRGAVDVTKHWGLAHILWSPSGVGYTALPSTASDQVRSMLSDVAVATSGERAVEQRVAERYGHYFTDSGAPARSATSANVPGLDAAIGAGTAALDQARAAVQRIDDLRRSHEDSSWEAQRISTRRTDIRKQLQETKAAAVAYDATTAQRERCASAEERRHQEASELQTRIAAIHDTRQKRAAIAAERGDVQTQIEALTGRSAAALEHLAASTRDADDAASACSRVQARATDVTTAATYVAALGDIRTLVERIARIDTDLAAIAELAEHRAKIFAPAKVELKTLRDIDIERRNLEAKIAASALALEITPDAAARIEIRIGDLPGIVDVTAGDAQTITGSEQIVVVIPGFGRIKTRATDSAASARRKHAPLVAQMNDAFERFGVGSLPELEDRFERATELDRLIQARQESLDARLNGDDPGADRTRLREAQVRVAAIAAAHPDWEDAAPDAVALRAGFDADLRQSADAENAAKRTQRAAHHVTDAIRSEFDTLVAAERVLAGEAQRHDLRLDDLTGDGRDDLQREAALTHASLEWRAARAEREQIDVQLSAFVENPHVIRAQLEAQELAAGAQYEDRHGRAQADLALLEEFAQRGSYRRLAEAEEALEALTARQRRERAEADAIRLLRSTFDAVRNDRIQAVLAPVAAGATRYLTRIAGGSLGPIHIAPDLTPLGVHHVPSGQLVEIASTLSAGEREQIYIATRFALADVIAGNRGRQLFVLDDILTATDPGRLRRFVSLLEELSRERLQIIVTTADAGRYLGISGAKHIDLRAALSIADAA